MRLQIEDPRAGQGAARGLTVLASGFRPFFLLAGLEAAAALGMWLVVWFGHVAPEVALAPTVWHAHELIFGFAAAAVAGFLLTAVPNWTGTAPLSGAPLMLLVAAWAAGRVAIGASGVLPAWAVAVADLAFLPLLGVYVGRPLVAAGKLRNIAFLPILGVLWLANLLVHLEAAGAAATATAGTHLAIYVLLLMIAIVGGRIIPSFTGNWLRMRGLAAEQRGVRWVELAAAPAVAVAGLADVLAPDTVAAGALLLAAAALHGYRLSGWQGWLTRSHPILWVLHVGYGWLVVGLALRGLSVFVADVPPTAALHAYTAGAVGTMIMAVMTRAALGHSGRPLTVPPAITLAYVLLTLAAALRVLGPVAAPGLAGESIMAAGVLWVAAWGIYVAVYLPILTRPRLDGRPG